MNDRCGSLMAVGPGISISGSTGLMRPLVMSRPRTQMPMNSTAMPAMAPMMNDVRATPAGVPPATRMTL